MSKIVFVSFASLGSKFGNNTASLVGSSKNLCDEYRVFSEKDLPELFVRENQFIFKQSKGFGCWIWKPFFILKTLESLEENDICFYIDAGNSIVSSTRPLTDICASSAYGVILFENLEMVTDGNAWTNRLWTKFDTFSIMGCLDNKYVDGKQVDAAYQLYKKNKFSIDFVKEYLFWCQNFHALTDSPNVYGDNFSGFIEHRHDQSILSILAIKHGIKLLSPPSQCANKFRPKDYPYQQIFDHHRCRN